MANLEKYGIFEFSSIVKAPNELKKFKGKVDRKAINSKLKQTKESKSKALFRTWKSICVLWKDALGAYSTNDKVLKDKFITRPSDKDTVLNNAEGLILRAYFGKKDNYNELSKELDKIESNFSGAYERKKRKIQKEAIKKGGKVGSQEYRNAEDKLKDEALNGKEVASLAPVTKRVGESLKKIVGYARSTPEGEEYLNKQKDEIKKLINDITAKEKIEGEEKYKYDISPKMREAIVMYFETLKEIKTIRTKIDTTPTYIDYISTESADPFFKAFLNNVKSKKEKSYFLKLQEALKKVNEVAKVSEEQKKAAKELKGKQEFVNDLENAQRKRNLRH